MTAKSIRADSVALEDMTGDSNLSTANELHKFMRKYEQLDKDRKKYMICFFVLFAFVIIFLVIILIGLTTSNKTSTSNIDTCHSECISSKNDFVTLTESDTDTPIASYNGYLDILLQGTNLTNYSRIMTDDGKTIDHLSTYLSTIRQNLSLYNTDTYLSVQRLIFQGNVDYEMLVKACSILLTGMT